MADWYVSALASGSGTGTAAAPWTLAQGAAATTPAAADTVWIKADGTYAAGATLNFAGGYVRYEGYGSAIGDGTQAVIQAGAAGITLVNCSADAQAFTNLRLLGNGFGTVSGIKGNGRSPYARNVFAESCATTGISGLAFASRCKTVNCGTSGQAAYESIKSAVNCSAIFTAAATRGFGTGNYSRCVCVSTSTLSAGIQVDRGDALVGNVVAAAAGSVQWALYVYGQFQPTLVRDNAIVGTNSTVFAANNSALTSGMLTTYAAEASATGGTLMSASPFIDGPAGDLRLTSAAKSATYANQLKAIMAGIVGTPGITTDSLADLVGGGASLIDLSRGTLTRGVA